MPTETSAKLRLLVLNLSAVMLRSVVTAAVVGGGTAGSIFFGLFETPIPSMVAYAWRIRLRPLGLFRALDATLVPRHPSGGDGGTDEISPQV